LFEQLEVSGEDLVLMKYKIKMDAISLDNPRKIEGEIQFVRKKVDEITKEIKQLENNISFISNAADDNPLVVNVKESIAKNSSTLILWKQKLTFLRGLL
jgi:peptidoglycan hydrolase CwlO-like protein